MDQAKSIFKKKSDEFELLKSLLSKNLGYIGKFTQYLMEENIPYKELENLYKEILNLKSKSQNIDISDLKYEEVLDRIQRVKEDLMYKSVVNQFPSEQRKIISDLDESEEESIRNIIISLSKMPNIETFISKISRYKNLDSLLDAIKVFTKSKDNSKEKVKEEIKNSSSQIVLDKGDVLILKINSWEDIKKFGSDTSWCIVSSESMWYSYTKGRSQFVLYNYNSEEHDPKFKIGFTVDKNGGIHAAHDILDNSCSNSLYDILKSIDSKISDLFPKRDPVDISKISKSTKNEDLSNLYETCEIKDIPELIKSLLSWKNKSDKFKKSSIHTLVKRYFADKKWILLKDLKDIDESLLKYIIFYGMNFGGKLLSPVKIGSSNEDKIKDGLKVWTDSEVLEMDMGSIILMVFPWNKKESNISKETIFALSNRLNEINKKGISKSISRNRLLDSYGERKRDNKDIEKMSKEIARTTLILNYYLGRGKSTINHDMIMDTFDKSDKLEYADLFNIKIDLTGYSYLPSDFSVNCVVKKDYPELKIHIYNHIMDKMCELSEYLSGHELNMLISKKSIRDILTGYRQSEKIKNSKLYSLIEKLSGQRKWSKVEDNKLSVQIDS